MSDSRHWCENDKMWGDLKSFLFGDEVIQEAASEIDSVLSILNPEPGARILDLCCGVGRHSLELARRGFAVTGVDRTESFLDTAAKAADKEKLDVEFVLEDMRRFCRTDSFDAVISMFTSFGYFKDQSEERRVAANICQSLKPGGKLLMQLASKERITKIFQKRDWSERDGVFMLEERTPVDNWRYIENRWILIKDGQKEEFNISLRLYSAVELADLLKNQGFSSVKFYGGLDGSPYDQNLKVMIAVAVK